jgi:HEAT repeat protein
LAAALQDPDLGVRQAAAVSLAKRQDARGLDLLMETAASADGGPSSVAAFALGELKDPRAVPALIAVVDREVRLYDPMRGDTGGARNMARALGQIGGPEALRALLGWLKATGMDRSYMFSETTEGLAAIGRPAVPGLLDLLKSDTTAVRRAAAQTLRQMKADQLDGQAIAPLVAALHDPASAVRASVVTALGRIPGTTTHLTAMMDDPAVEVRSAAASALGRLSGEEAMAAVVVALSDSSPNVRGSAVQALRELTRDIAPPAGATPALLAILDDESVYGRFAAATVLIRSGVPEGLNSWRARVGEGNGAQRAQAIREFVPDTPGAEAHDPRVIEVLLGMTGDPETEVRQAAISVLGRTGDGRAFEPVLKLLEDADPAVRRSAAVALGTLKDPRAVEPLIALLGRRGAPLNAPDERSVGARIEAASALEKITGQKFGADADAWQAWWNENKQAAPATAAGEER